ncbi:hypothetical protein [Methylovirgula sp. HY1]|uniref:hypothetical protein n=1 Tax=Methylovirgula sp. HY1 TaxID=2822761 RepID=UPI001C5B1617|nr:hypothetical protein [Methylovirgula sp. HY1]QXX73753.1 hypothetical protein MHY1_00553 [Methylovirgula sp. HY1]
MRCSRLERSCSSGTGGAGLGLGIARSSTEVQGGEIAIGATLKAATGGLVSAAAPAMTMLSPGPCYEVRRENGRDGMNKRVRGSQKAGKAAGLEALAAVGRRCGAGKI